MSSKLKALVFGACATAMSCGVSGASAQIESEGLGALDPWGRGYLAEDEQGFPKSFWRASRTEDLLPLMRDARTRSLTPAERTLLRRVVLSPGYAPSGDMSKALLAERARLMFDLGEAFAAADLMGKLEESPKGIVAEELAVDLQFALGQAASACNTVRTPGKTGEFWLRMRAVCFALEGDQAGAELAVELAQASDIRDEWLFSAISAAFVSDGPKPAARFDTGYALTVSVLADLTVPINAVGYSRPDLAAAMAKRETLPPELRVLAAGAGAEAGLVSPQEQLNAYAALLSEEDFQPTSPVEAALVSLAEKGSSNSDRARHIATALQASRGSSARFYAVARLLGPALQTLKATEETDRYASVFAAALLSLGRPEDAQAWIASAAAAEDAEERAFEHHWLTGLGVLLGNDADDRWIEALIDAADSKGKIAATSRLLTIFVARDVPVPAAGRAYLVGQGENQSDGSDPTARVAAILAAAQSDAAGEAVLHLLKLTDGDPSKVPAGNLVVLLKALDELSLDDAADALALEATGFWKTSLASN